MKINIYNKLQINIANAGIIFSIFVSGLYTFAAIKGDSRTVYFSSIHNKKIDRFVRRRISKIKTFLNNPRITIKSNEGFPRRIQHYLFNYFLFLRGLEHRLPILFQPVNHKHRIYDHLGLIDTLGYSYDGSRITENYSCEMVDQFSFVVLPFIWVSIWDQSLSEKYISIGRRMDRKRYQQLRKEN